MLDAKVFRQLVWLVAAEYWDAVLDWLALRIDEDVDVHHWRLILLTGSAANATRFIFLPIFIYP